MGTHFTALLPGSDFPDFYCASRMLAEGHGHQLYDAGLQRQYQARYAGRVGTLFIHPPFEAALYLSVAWLPLKSAYLLWCLLNLVFLIIGVRCLTDLSPQLWDWRMCLVASLTFVPLLLCLQQGQDSLLLLLLVILAFIALRRDRGFAAGGWLGLGLFKFQLVLPLMLLLALTQRREKSKQLVQGFGVVLLGLAALSAAMAGWTVFTAYPKFLLQLGSQPFAGIDPAVMTNFRGLVHLLFRGEHSAGALTALLILSAGALLVAVASKPARVVSAAKPTNWTPHNFDLACANALLFALLVSYHLNPHDLTLLLLPTVMWLRVLMARRGDGPRRGRLWPAALLAILFLPPLHLWALRAGLYSLISLPLLLLFLTGSSMVRHSRGT